MNRHHTRGGAGAFSISRRGFTLIEMLVVIVVIAILMGLVFRLSRLVAGRNESAREVARVAILKSLIEEFHAEYGIYPPVPEYDGVQPISFTGPYPDDAGDLDYYIANYAHGDTFQFGLLSFFFNRVTFATKTFQIAGQNGNPNATGSWQKYNDKVGDGGHIEIPDKDKAFVKRVKPIVGKLGNEHSNLSDEPFAVYDSSGRHTLGFEVLLRDSWGRDYVYMSEPPYSSFIVFSKGPDGKYDKNNPSDRTIEANKDNIYGDLGDK